MKKNFFVIILLIISFSSYEQSWQDTTAMIEKIFSRYNGFNAGCQLAISRNGQIIFSKAWGMADLEHNVALTTQSIIEAGSVSKQFTAACILLLQQQGKLSLNDDVRKYIPELPDYGTPILLKNMLHHTSGFKDWESIAALSGFPQGAKTYDNNDVLRIMMRQKSLNNKPGDEFLYSNSNYNLLAIIIKRVSGMELDEFSRKYIFEPAGMTHTSWRNNFKNIVANRAIAYAYNGNSYYTDMPNANVYGNGGLLTTAEDLLAWNNYYLNDKLGNPSLLQQQLATDTLNNGYIINYAAGLVVTYVLGQKMIGHNGSTAGYRSNLFYFPDKHLSIAWLSNTSRFDGDIMNMMNLLERIFITDNVVKPQPKNVETKAQPKDTSSLSVSPEQLNKYTGWFKNERSGQPLNLFIKDGKLTSSVGGVLTAMQRKYFCVE